MPARPTILTAFGETKSVVDWAADARCRVSAGRIVRRLKAGWLPEKAITEPATPGRQDAPVGDGVFDFDELMGLREPLV